MRNSKFPNRLPYMEITSFSIPFMGRNGVNTIKGNFSIWEDLDTNIKHLYCLSLSFQVVKIFLFRVLPLLSSALSMYTQSSTKPGTFYMEPVPFHMEFDSNWKRFGRLTLFQISRTDNFILNQPPKSLEKTILEHLKSTNSCKSESMSFESSASSRRIFSMVN